MTQDIYFIKELEKINQKIRDIEFQMSIKREELDMLHHYYWASQLEKRRLCQKIMPSNAGE